jgi:hypothetical protein
MRNVESDRSQGNIMKGYWQRILIPVFLLAFILPAWGDDKSKGEERLKNAAKVLNEMTGSKNVPLDVLGRANCIIVLPSVKKFGFGIGGAVVAAR